MTDRATPLPIAIHELIDRLKASRDRETAGCALDLVQALMEFHGAGIHRMMDIVDEQCGWPALEKLGNDELVSSMLLVHGLHPLDVESRVGMALEKVRPLLRSHGGNVELVEVSGTVVRLRMTGSCHGCSSSADTIKNAIEQSISITAPDITSIEVLGGSDETASKTTALQVLSPG